MRYVMRTRSNTLPFALSKVAATTAAATTKGTNDASLNATVYSDCLSILRSKSSYPWIHSLARSYRCFSKHWISIKIDWLTDWLVSVKMFRSKKRNSLSRSHARFENRLRIFGTFNWRHELRCSTHAHETTISRIWIWWTHAWNLAPTPILKVLSMIDDYFETITWCPRII